MAQAQADANRARGESLQGGNQELIAANRLVELLPALVQGAAKGLADSQLTVLNGTQGVNEVIAGLIGQGITIMDSLRHAAAVTGNGPGAAGPGTAIGEAADPVPPRVPVQQPGQGGDHGAVGPARSRAGDPPQQDRDRVPEDQDLRVAR